MYLGKNRHQRFDDGHKVGKPAPETPNKHSEDDDDLSENMRLLHELQVHHLELETQNEELRRIQRELELSGKKYVELYDLAPVGYFTLNSDGIIQESNLTGARLLNRTRRQIIGKRFSEFIDWECMPAFRDHLKRVFEDTIGSREELVLKSAKDEKLYVQLSSRSFSNEDEKTDRCFVAVTDVSKLKDTEEMLKSSQVELRCLNDHLRSASEQERARVAGQIHDEIGQNLTRVKMDLAWLQQQLKGYKEPFGEKLKYDSDMIDGIVKAINRIISELRPGLLDHIGLGAAIEWRAGEFQKQTGIICEVKVDPEHSDFAPEMATALFRIFEESIRNVGRHAGASLVKVNLMKVDSVVYLEVADNGIGVKKERLRGCNTFGMLSMREGVRKFNGDMSISGAPGEGTTVKVTIPLA